MMDFFKRDHALIRGLLVGAVALASATACSRSDRTETGSNNTGTVTADTSTLEGQTNAATQPAADTTTALNADTTSSAAPAAAPRAETATRRAEAGSNRDTATAGYSGMERDTSSADMAVPRDTARATNDSATTPSEQSSVTPSDSAPMEVATPTIDDSSTSTSDVAVQEDTAAIEVAASPEGESPEAAAVRADSSVEMAGAAGQDSVADSAAGYSEMAADTSTTTEQSDTTMAPGHVDAAAQADTDSAGTVDAAVASSDTTVRVGDSAHVARTGERLEPVVASAEVNDTLTESEGRPVRPPEDSTPVQEDRETVAAADAQTGNAETDEVGAAAVGGNVSGADAVALMTRQGARCIVVDPESAQGVAMDMSQTPATLNPCGLGSMVLTRIWTNQE